MYYQIDMIHISLSPHPRHHPRLASWADHKDLVLVFAVICAIGALISMVGDLAASAIKRNHEIKDYGTLIPGHGGILDRFDSVIFTAPVIYVLALMFFY